MEGLTGEAQHLIQIVDEVNSKINNLAASTEEIAASASVVGEVSNKLKEQFEKIISM